MFEVRPCRDHEEFGRAMFAIGQYFGAPLGDEVLERFATILEHDRMHAAFEDGEIVGGAGAYPFVMSVPGGNSLACAGMVAVGVYPTHRRRGVLRAMMDAQLRAAHERGDPLASLWASEEMIYGRFGFGLASWTGKVELERSWSAYASPFRPRGRVRFVPLEEALDLCSPVWDALARDRPGVFGRTRPWWQHRRLRVPDEEKATPRRCAVLELDGEVRAYALFRQIPDLEGMISRSRLVVIEAIGSTPEATAEIWRFLLDVDWYATLEAALLPPDHPLFTLLANPRRLRYRMGDSLWMRLVDVGAALSRRAYASDGAVVFEVRDAACPWNEGRWKLEGGVAARTDDPAELALDVSALGSAYLGAVPFAQLRDGLRVEELAEGAVRKADALFGWRPLPWCPEIF